MKFGEFRNDFSLKLGELVKRKIKRQLSLLYDIAERMESSLWYIIRNQLSGARYRKQRNQIFSSSSKFLQIRLKEKY